MTVGDTRLPRFRMRCVGCPIATFHSVDEACDEHSVNPAAFLSKLWDTAKAATWSRMRSGWAVTTDHLVPRTQAAKVLRAGAHSTLHGVVFAILCPGPAVHRRRVSALRPGHEIVLRTNGESIRRQPIPI